MNSSYKRMFLDLIRPLGIAAARKKDNEKLVSFRGGRSGKTIVLFQEADCHKQICMRSNVPLVVAVFTFATYKKALNSLLKEITSFYLANDDDIKFDNPYFGCNSLEEALIKKDLIVV